MSKHFIINTFLIEELAVLLLDEELPNQTFLTFGSAKHLAVGSPLEIVGYQDLSKVTSNRNELKGRVHSLVGGIINHTAIQTQVEKSGSQFLHITEGVSTK